MKAKTKIILILFALRAFALSAVFAVALIALAPAAFAETKTERLLGEPLNEFAVDENGWTHLHWAAVVHDEESVQRLLEMGAPVDFTNNGDGSDFSDEANLRLAVVLGRKDAKRKKWGKTPLMLVASFKVASILIAGGADINAKDKPYGWSLLHWSVELGDFTRALFLLDNGADVNVKATDGRTPLHLVAGNRTDRTDTSREVFMAGKLLQNGADINAKDENGWSPLHYAAQTGSVMMAGFLLDNGAYVNAESPTRMAGVGVTAWDVAKIMGRTDMMTLLARNGGRRGRQ